MEKIAPNHQPNDFLKWDYGFMVMKIGFPMDVIFMIFYYNDGWLMGI
jgi:hypothetical protein